MVEVEVTAIVKVKFHSYGTVKKDAQATRQIKQFIKDTLVQECSFVPMQIEGEDEEDCTSKARISVSTEVVKEK